MPRFSFDTRGAKEKLAKENAEKEISPSAEGAKGYSPLTSQTFEKSLIKTFWHFDSANTFVSELEGVAEATPSFFARSQSA